MARIKESQEIAAAPADLFRLCHDLDRRPEWDERVVGAEMLTPPPLRQGSLIRIDEGRGGQFLFSWDAEYSSYQFPSGSTLKVLDAAPSSPFVRGTETWRFDKTSEGTRFTIVWEYKTRGILARIMDVLGRRGATRRAIRKSLENVRELVALD
jgi:hypothetical protein